VTIKCICWILFKKSNYNAGYGKYKNFIIILRRPQRQWWSTCVRTDNVYLHIATSNRLMSRLFSNAFFEFTYLIYLQSFEDWFQVQATLSLTFSLSVLASCPPNSWRTRDQIFVRNKSDHFNHSGLEKTTGLSCVQCLGSCQVYIFKCVNFQRAKHDYLQWYIRTYI
jgi:hypothetical protein